jgi:hypothetical protein
VTYRGTAVFEEQDESAHRMVLIASGKETRGQGTARATVTGTLAGRDGGTAVSVRTDLTVTGRPAQFGRGVMAEVGDKLVGQFAECLARRLNEPTTPEPEPVQAAQPVQPVQPVETVRPVEPVEPIDLLRTAGLPVAKRVAVAAATAVLALVFLRIRRHRHA